MFESAATLSDDVWLMLATCEAVARAGGRVHADDVAVVLREWTLRHRFKSPALPASERSLVLRVAPLAFVLDPGKAQDDRQFDDIVRLTHSGKEAGESARSVMSAMRACLDERRLREDRMILGGPSRPLLTGACALLARFPDDLESALDAALATEEPADVACLTGLLLGASGCDIPKPLLSALPERSEVEAVIEPFAQLVAAVAS